MKMLALVFALFTTSAFADTPRYYQPLDGHYVPVNTANYYKYVDSNLHWMYMPCNSERLSLLDKSDEVFVVCVNQKYNVVVK